MKFHNSSELSNEIIDKANSVAVICNQGQSVMAGMELVNLLEIILGNFGLFSEIQQKELKILILNLENCQKNNDYYGIADYLLFELPFILAQR